MRACIVTTGLIGLAYGIPGSQIRHGRQTPSSIGSPTVTVKNGTIAGLHRADYNQDYFLGIPFAQPPLDSLRFRNPQSINTTWSDTLQTTAYASACLGYGGDQVGYPQSEDCLYLNVIRPSGYENQSLPVGVWIHGGGLIMGSAIDERYNLTFIVENSVHIGKPIIGVSIQYRLGPWGFLQSQEVSGAGQTNIGLRDQRLALHWINENIHAFGGDKDKVTIWGESAGAGSVGFHLTAYNGRDDGLFRAGIMQSGNPVNYRSYQTNEHFQPMYDSLVNATNCTAAIDTLQCLRDVPSATLANLFSTTSLNSGWGIIVDGDLIQRWASIQLSEGAFVKVPIISGANTDEGVSFGPTGINTDSDFLAYLTNTTQSTNLPAQFAPEVLTAYPNTPDYYIPPVEELGNDYTYPTRGTQYRRSAAYAGDAIFIANRRGTVETWCSHSIPAYSYRFNTRPSGTEYTSGVGHFQEVALVFSNTLGLGYNSLHGTVNPFLDQPQSYYELADVMSKSWASFIYDLDPNYEVTRGEGVPMWPRYELEEPRNAVFDANVTGLIEVEADTWREEGIRWILEHNLVYRR